MKRSKFFFDAYKNEKEISKKIFRFFDGFLNRKALIRFRLSIVFGKRKKGACGYFDTYHGTWSKNIFNEFNISDVVLPVEFDGEIKRCDFAWSTRQN